jgi:hypothetical protein
MILLTVVFQTGVCMLESWLKDDSLVLHSLLLEVSWNFSFAPCSLGSASLAPWLLCSASPSGDGVVPSTWFYVPAPCVLVALRPLGAVERSWPPGAPFAPAALSSLMWPLALDRLRLLVVVLQSSLALQVPPDAPLRFFWLCVSFADWPSSFGWSGSMHRGGVPPRGVLAVTAIGWECGWWFVHFVVCCCDVCLAFGVRWTLPDDVVTCT